MRRADRLFLLIHALRGRRRAVPARRLAEDLGVSLRTVYRDVADLQRSGVPIEGEAGVGYVLRRGADVPPLMFTPGELEALEVGVRFVRAFAGRQLAVEAKAAMLKIEAVLPADLHRRAERTRIYAPVWEDDFQRQHARLIDTLHQAIAERRVLQLAYADGDGQRSEREVEPLCLACWGGKWTLGAWCRLRRGFRNFRPDRMQTCQATGELHEEHPERNLAAYFTAMGQAQPGA